MPTPTNYNYTATVDVGKLCQTIRQSSIATALDHITTVGTAVSILFKDVLSVADNATLDAIMATDQSVPLPNPIVNTQLVGANGKIADAIGNGVLGASGDTFVSHDLSDRTTWYQNSIRVTTETLTTSDNLLFRAINQNLINIYSRRLIYARNHIPMRDGTFTKHSLLDIKVYVNGTLNTSGFTIQHASGTVTFASSQAGNTITCTYSHNNGVANVSEWIFAPPAGKTYQVENVELQFSKGVYFNAPIRFEVWAGNTVAYFTAAGWADALFDGGYGQKRYDYQDVVGVINQANGGTIIPACPNAGLAQDIIIQPFNYVKSILLDGNVKAIIRISIVGDVAMTNADLATATFYSQIYNS